MRYVRLSDLLVWTAFTETGSDSGTGTAQVDFVVPIGQIWEVTSGGVRAQTVGGSTALFWGRGNSFLASLSTTLTPFLILSLPSTVWLNEGETLRARNSNGGASATIEAVITGRRYYLDP